MKVDKIDRWIITGYFCGSILIVITSWISNMYGEAVRNILSAEGIRHAIKYAMHNFEAASPASLLYIAAGYGIVMKSGICRLLRHVNRLSLRQRSAVGVTVFIGLLYLVLVGLGLFLPHAILLGVTGHIERSAFSEGWVYVTTTFFLLVGIVYGISAGIFHKLDDIIKGLCAGMALFAPCFIVLFLGTQLLSFLVYSDIFSLNVGDTSFLYCKIIVLYLPFLIKAFCGLFMKGDD